MTDPVLRSVDDVADELCRELSEAAPGDDAVWQVTGPPTSGKSTLVERLATRLRSAGLWPIVVAPPSGHLDAGAVALLEVGVGLKAAGALNGQVEELMTSQQSWASKWGQVQSWLSQQDVRQHAVLLCDEPEHWRGVDEEEGPSGHVNDAIQLVLRSTSCRRVVVGDLAETVKVRRRERLTASSEVEGWLNADETWGSLRSAASDLLAQGDGHQLKLRTPLEVRLLVALSALTSPRQVVGALANLSRRGIAQRLRSELASTKPHLLEVWDALALVRRPFTRGLLERVGCDKLDEDSRAMLEHCVLYERGDKLVLHEMLRHDSLSAPTLNPRQLQTSHRTLSEYYAARFEEQRATDSAEALRSEAEGFHHAANAGLDVVAEFRPFFGDQLDSWARTVSLSARHEEAKKARKLHLQAAELYGRALSWDESDDYAHHYRAYNLDVIGEQPNAVEAGYRRAIEINSRPARWHSRYVSLLLTLGRPLAAERAWDEAIDALQTSLRAGDRYVYDELHRWVIRLLLHRGQLRRARELLDGVPKRVRKEEPAFQALERRCVALETARTSGALVPTPFLTEDWWERGPFLLERELDSGYRLKRWIAARVDGTENKALQLRVATVTKSGFDVGSATLTFRELEALTKDTKPSKLGPGRFLEIGVYSPPKGKKKPARQRIRVHQELSWNDEALPPVGLDPTRYLKFD